MRTSLLLLLGVLAVSAVAAQPEWTDEYIRMYFLDMSDGQVRLSDLAMGRAEKFYNANRSAYCYDIGLRRTWSYGVVPEGNFDAFFHGWDYQSFGAYKYYWTREDKTEEFGYIDEETQFAFFFMYSPPYNNMIVGASPAVSMQELRETLARCDLLDDLQSHMLVFERVLSAIAR